MEARRRRNHKKRKPKFYPPTNIKTRSMEQRERYDSDDGFFEWDRLSEMALNSSEFN